MPDRSRIPRSFEAFSAYIAQTDDYLLQGEPQTNASRLGLLQHEVDEWHAVRKKWDTLYPLYENKHVSRTILVTAQLHELIGRMKRYNSAHNLLNRIAASPESTVTDLSVFNIKSGPLAKQSKSRPIQPIDALVLPNFKLIGGGELIVKCHNDKTMQIAIIKDAEFVEYLFCADNEPPPSLTDKRLDRGFSPRAMFIIALGAENSGLYANFYFRWINSKYPELAGPWSQLYRTLIL
ncbi:hypothetical protein [Mangrovibacterium lignilyticum]|uniref:hypothetical protein n=1 Tax=Mangrovibacterium lignilyticum TaxID=2668052 RepID=UPI0013D5A5A9|nr:hypothetical protein [Mangrovibacterium lignilyticum]